MSYFNLLLSPPMMVTLLALLLTSSTSMLVNDYYDFKLGNDNNKPLKALQKVPLAVCKKALYYLYALALITATGVPGVPARLAVTGGLILTFLYTKHVKPRTWYKNVLCASLISLSPLTSGVAAMTVISANSAVDTSNILFGHFNWPLVRLVGLLFVGIMGREMTMDINDFDDDATHDVRTVPVVYGRKYASRIALICSLIVSSLATSGPFLASLEPSVLIRRSVLAVVGSLVQMRRYWNVAKTDGLDANAVDLAVNEGLSAVILILASFV
jgi:4-hydroxybenzoate polyprenyltransferase